MLVGDLVDRGPDSAAVIRWVRSRCAAGAMTCVLGNHDDLFVQVLLLLRPDLVEAAGLSPDDLEPLVRDFRFAPTRVLRHWLSQGGTTTIRSYHGEPTRPETWSIPPEDVAFLACLPLAWRGDSMVVTHARAGHGAIQEALTYTDTPWRVAEDARYELLWSRRMPTDPPETLHVSGHTPREEPLRDGNTVEIDTGCVFGNALTAFDAVTGEFLQTTCDRT